MSLVFPDVTVLSYPVRTTAKLGCCLLLRPLGASSSFFPHRAPLVYFKLHPHTKKISLPQELDIQSKLEKKHHRSWLRPFFGAFSSTADPSLHEILSSLGVHESKSPCLSFHPLSAPPTPCQSSLVGLPPLDALSTVAPRALYPRVFPSKSHIYNQGSPSGILLGRKKWANLGHL